tara:strand:+ start:23555 stop:23881 length:327 start_codon:yes stop_codon:yes gene_type:complete
MAQESDIEKRLNLYAADHGCYVRKFTSNNVGVPDRIYVKGVTLFLEIKAPGKVPSPVQQDEIGIICRVGGFASFVDNYDDGVIFLNLVLANRGDLLKRACKEKNYWMK